MAEIRHGTLAANTVATVTFTKDWTVVEVLNRSGTAEIYFRTDGVDPTIGGDDCEVVAAGLGSTVVEVVGSAASSVRLISTAAEKYTVRASGHGIAV